MTITVVNIGTSATALTTLKHSITVPVGGVPAGAAIVVVTSNSTILGTVKPTDDGSNTYTQIQAKTYNSPFSAAAFYAPNVSALTSGSTITYTTTNTQVATVSALYITGLTTNPLDSTITASATSTSLTPTVTSGSPSASGEVFIGWTAAVQALLGLTRSTDWATPPSSASGGGVFVDGGNLISTGTATKTWNPTLSAQTATYNGIFAFTAATTSTGAVAVAYRMLMLRGMGQ